MLIPKRVFKISALAARDTSRHPINGVFVAREAGGKCLAVATDGRRLIRVRWNDKHLRPKFPAVGLGSVESVKDFSAIVATKQWDDAGKAIPKRANKPILEHCLLDETGINGKVTMGSLNGDTVEGKFPGYKNVIPNYTIGKDAVEIDVNPKLMAEILKVVETVATDDKSRSIRLVVPTDPSRPIVIKGHTADGIEATAILMPITLSPKP